SALASGAPPEYPPATSTNPFPSEVALWSCRAVRSEPVVQLPSSPAERASVAAGKSRRAQDEEAASAPRSTTAERLFIGLPSWTEPPSPVAPAPTEGLGRST